MAGVSAETNALALRIWSWCEQHGWEHTALEIAEALTEQARAIGDKNGETTGPAVAGVLRAKGWIERIRQSGQVGNGKLGWNFARSQDRLDGESYVPVMRTAHLFLQQEFAE